MLGLVRSLVHRSVRLSALSFMRTQWLTSRGVRPHQSGSTLSRRSVESSVEYTLDCFSDYLRYSGLDPLELEGKHVLEVGPGDSLGVALCFLAHGAASVTTLDRFYSDRSASTVDQVHAGVLDALPPTGRARAAAALAAWKAGDNTDLLRYEHGVPVERATECLEPGTFDLIVSRAVLEHVYDLELAWSQMCSLLGPNGQMWHKVDLRCHGFFARFGALYFLRFRDESWKRISSPDPTLNRERRQTYDDLCERHFTSTSVWTTHVLDRDEIIPHVEALELAKHYTEQDLRDVSAMRSSLHARFSGLPDRDLLTTGIFLVARQPRKSGSNGT